MTDWLARQVRGVIDFKLDSDVSPMTLQRLDERIAQYYAQLRSARRSAPATQQSAAATDHNRPPEPLYPFDDPIDF